MKKETQTSSHQAAHSVLSACNVIGESATPLKLIKLVYISHGYHLAMTGKPLFYEQVEAWKYGPVVPEIYYAVKQFGKGAIPPSVFAGYEDRAEGGVSHGSDTVINDVVAAYGKYDGLQLSAATHKQGTPWDKVYNANGEGAVISNGVIKSYYEGLLKK